MHRNKSVSSHKFAMVPRAEIPRSKFVRQSTHKTTFDAGYLIPIYVDEVLPGDTFNFKATMFARMATPIFPVMDNLHLDSFFFFVPNRLLWSNFVKMMGERDNPDDSISYICPTVTSPTGGFPVGSIYDYMGLPTVGQVAEGETIIVNSLPLRAYNRIYNSWFRDQNFVDSVPQNTSDANDQQSDYVLLKRGKRHDYFTSCLPFMQKGDPVQIGLSGEATVTGTGNLVHGLAGPTGSGLNHDIYIKGDEPLDPVVASVATGSSEPIVLQIGDHTGSDIASHLSVDLSSATAMTINMLRTSFQIQKLLERDARGGTRYTEIIRSHFGVTSPDARLQRPEYLGGGTTPININPIAQTSATGLTGGSSPLGGLGAFGTALSHGHGFSASFTEHGIIIGLVCVRADLTYQQGIEKLWLRSGRYDFYFPAFAALGEQAVLNKEIYADGSENDDAVFGYQERWAEYRYKPSKITGLFKSTSQGTIDGWHLAQRFATLPALNDEFILENPPMSRILAVGSGANGQQFIFDAFFDNVVVRPMPMYSVPGLIDHF